VAASRIQRWWLNQKAGWLLFLKKPAAAQAIYEHMIALNPQDVGARSLLAGMLAEQGHTEAALTHLQTLERDNPKDGAVLFNIGFIHEQAERTELAEDYFRRALALQPNIDRAWYGLGLVLIKQGRLKEALEALKRNTELQPMSPYGWYQLAMTHHHLGDDGEAKKIRKHLEQFEPKVAKQLARDLDSTPATAVPAAGGNG
jgi:tetratricopeptide (TPR) repeat protein